MSLSHTSHEPSLVDKTVAPVARVWQWIQDGVARWLGFKNSGNLAAVVGIIGLTAVGVASALGPLAPATYSAGLWTAKAGGVGLVENHITKKVAKWDGKG